MTSGVRIGAAELNAFAARLFVAAGVPEEDATAWARVLVWANARGADSHGVLRIPAYVERIRKGAINPRPAMRVERRSGAIAVLEADRAPGAVAMLRAMEEAIARARVAHIGWCAARNITHAGAIGYFALKAAEQGMAGIAMTASGPMMAYYGARVAGVSTNPIAIAAPARRRRPLLLDMSTATVPLGKVLAARDRNEAVPPGWGVDAQGRETTDPHAIATLLPLGGPKGSGLSLMIECLCSLTVGNPLIARALLDRSPAESPVLNGVAIAVDLAALGDVEAFRDEADRVGDALTALPAAEGVERIFLPGERGDTLAAQREREGIPLPKGTWDRLLATANSLGVDPPLP
ncbi:MAG: Ldh family oxidoreductase [Variibacter sp.]|nr:Ldh family oxidoreductase [Variibacter sp.]